MKPQARLALAILGLAVAMGCGGPPPPAHVTSFVNAAPKGSVPVVAFIDFECSFCKVAHARLEAAAAAKGANLVIDYRHVPLRSHPHATEAAAAQICAAEQGRGSEAVHALLAVGPNGHDVEHLLQLARELELHEQRFTTCMSSDTTRARLASDRRIFIDAQFDGVPVMFVGTELLDGTRSSLEYEAAVEKARKR